jgi:hypothetical protein
MDKRKLAYGMAVISIVIFLWNTVPRTDAQVVQPKPRHVETTVSHREVIKLSGGSLFETSTVTHTTSAP